MGHDGSGIIDDTGFPKQGRHSVGVARQYCGQLGKQDNCQVAVSLSVANHHASLPVAYRLYLPQDWAKDRSRWRKAGVPKEISFKTKPEIALEQLHWACEAGLPRGVVLMDAGYGADTAVRANITTLGLSYVAGIRPNTTVWAPGTGPLPPKKWSGQGRPPKPGFDRPVTLDLRQHIAASLLAALSTMALAAKRAPERTSRSSWPLACKSSKRPSVAITC